MQIKIAVVALLNVVKQEDKKGLHPIKKDLNFEYDAMPVSPDGGRQSCLKTRQRTQRDMKTENHFYNSDESYTTVTPVGDPATGKTTFLKTKYDKDGIPTQ